MYDSVLFFERRQFCITQLDIFTLELVKEDITLTASNRAACSKGFRIRIAKFERRTSTQFASQNKRMNNLLMVCLGSTAQKNIHNLVLSSWCITTFCYFMRGPLQKMTHYFCLQLRNIVKYNQFAYTLSVIGVGNTFKWHYYSSQILNKCVCCESPHRCMWVRPLWG